MAGPVTDALTWIEAHQGLGSWVQAMAGLLAIFAALGIAAWESHRSNTATRASLAREEARQLRQESRDTERSLTLHSAASALLALVVHRVEVAAELIARKPNASLIVMCRTHQADLASMEGQLSAFPIYDLGNMRCADIVAQALVALRGARIYLDHELVELAANYERRHEKVSEKLTEIAGHLAEMLQLFEEETAATPLVARARE